MKIIAAIKSFFVIIKTILLLLALVFAVFFLVNNREIVVVNFKPLPFNSVETRVFVLIIAGYGLGICTAMVFASANFIKKSIVKLGKFLPSKK